MINDIHHIALIVGDLDRSLAFYCDLLGFRETARHYREERQSWKVDLQLDRLQLELFTFRNAPDRPSYPEARGLRHLAFQVDDVRKTHRYLMSNEWEAEEIRTDPYTGKEFFFTADPDGTPIEFYAG